MSTDEARGLLPPLLIETKHDALTLFDQIVILRKNI